MIVFVILIAIFFVIAFLIIVTSVIYVIVVGAFNEVVEEVCFNWCEAAGSSI